MGLLGASMSLGFMIGPGIGGFLSKLGLLVPFYAAAGASVFAAILSIFILPNVAPVISPEKLHGKAENLLKQLKRSTKTPYFIMLIVMFVFSFGLANFQSTISFMLTKVRIHSCTNCGFDYCWRICWRYRPNICHQSSIQKIRRDACHFVQLGRSCCFNACYPVCRYLLDDSTRRNDISQLLHPCFVPR